MEQPQIRYCTTDDGVSIAYTALGDGEPIVITAPMGFSHLQLELAYPPLRAWYEHLARSCRVVRFDWRAQGVSQRDVRQFPEAWAGRDIDAVVSALQVERVDLLGCGAAGFAACDYAAARPERVRRLILWSVIADATPWGSAQVEAALSLADKDYVAFTETLAAAVLGWSDTDAAHRWARFMRAAMSEEDFRRVNAAGTLLGVSAGPAEVLAAVQAPTVVIYPAHAGNIAVEAGQRLASSIRTATLVVCTDDASGLPIGGQATRAIESALGLELQPADVEQLPATRTILFTDIVGHTEMMRRLGDDRGRAVLREHERITREVLKEFGGAEVKTMGDGFMASFGSVTKALDCAIALQRAFAAHEGETLQVRVGMNAGEPIEEDGDLFGSTVIMASRVAAQAGAGQILIPEPVRHLLSGKTYVYADRGDVMLKGFEDAVRLYEVRWRE